MYYMHPCFMGLIHRIIIPMYNVHSYFSLRDLGRTVHIIYGQIW